MKYLSNILNSRENILIALVNKLIQEYKALFEYLHMKPFKIVDIKSLSPIPGETIFIIQIANKNIVLELSAAEILQKNYELSNFSDFHAEMIRKAG